jgi:predicted RNase H-like HicB family nuclease
MRAKPMRYTVLVKHRPDGTYQASVPIMPGLSEVGSTREEVIEAVTRGIRATMENAEFVSIELPEQPPATANPWISTAGMFADDESLEGMLQDIYAARDAE